MKYCSKIVLLDGFIYLRNIAMLVLLEGLVFDDEPLWEPLEWSLAQTFILYVYLFSWAAEVIFSSRYGSYTNRDKIVWLGLFKTYFLLKLWFFINLIIVAVFITAPFYFEITYSISYMSTWWNWFNSIFFFKFSTVFALVFFIGTLFRNKVRWQLHSNMLPLMIFSVLLLCYLFYINFIILLFGYFTQIDLFKENGWSSSFQITHGPLKWGWGSDSRDHFAYHKTPTTFWYKNDPLIAGSMLFLNIFILKFLFFLLLQCFAIIRVILVSGEISINLTTYYFSNLKQFMNFIFFLNILILMSTLYQYIRYPFELLWFENSTFLFYNLFLVFYDLAFEILHLFI